VLSLPPGAGLARAILWWRVLLWCGCFVLHPGGAVLSRAGAPSFSGGAVRPSLASGAGATSAGGAAGERAPDTR
jgi:hypothetical protein